MIDADADPATVWGHIVDTVGNRFAHTRVHEVMPAYPLGSALGLILTPAMGQVADQCLFLRIDRDDRLTARLKVLDAGLDVRKWRGTVRMRRPRLSVAGTLSTGVESLESLADGAVAHRMALPAQLFRQPARALTGPAHGRHRVASRRRLHECIQGLKQLLILRCQWLAAGTLVAKTSAHVEGRGRARQRLFAQPHRACCEPRRTRYCRHATVAETEGLSRRPQTSSPFVSLGLERLILRFDRLFLGARNHEGEYKPMTAC